MAYIGVQPTAGQYRKLDNISASFNGSTTSFTTSVGGTNVTAGTAQQLIVSLGGVIQQPDTDYTVSTNTITFTTAPTSGLDFFAILMGDALNTVTPSDGSVTTSKLAGSLSVGLTAGSASTPALFFTGDTNNGIFSPSTDAIAVTTAGSERLRVTSAGLVGIGTSSPVEALTVNGRVQCQWNAFANGGTTSYSGDATSLVTGSTAGMWAARSDSALLFSIGSSEKARIDSSGRLGIGNSSPDNTLSLGEIGSIGQDVNSLYVGGNFTGTGANFKKTGNYSQQLMFDTSVGSIVFKNTASTGTAGNAISYSERMRIDASGRLLVGTSTARSNLFGGGTAPQLQVEGTSFAQTTFSIVRNENISSSVPGIVLGKTRGSSNGANTVVQSGDNLGLIDFQGADGTNLIAAARISADVDGTPGANDMPGRLVFSTTADGASSPTERMRIKSDGQTYWVADTPSTTSYGTSIGRAGLPGLFETARNAGATNSVANFHGNVGSAVVYGDGDLENTNGRYTAFSDIRFKQNIEDSASQWEDLKAIRIRKYELKTNPDRKHIGVVAQELEQVCPGLVIERENTDGETYKSVAYSVLYTKAVKALQEAMERIEQLEAKVAALESA